MYLWLANLVVVLHMLLVTGVVVGTVLAIAGVLRRYPPWELGYYMLLTATLTSHFLWGECIMTVWEKALRNRFVPGSAYHNSCILHYLPWLPMPVLNCLAPTLMVTGLLAFPVWRLVDRRCRRPDDRSPA